MNVLDPERDDADNIVAVYLIVNEGEFTMSPGKLAAQAFQACQRLLEAVADGAATSEQVQAMEAWRQGGTRRITKFAPTRHLFDRARAEIAGVTMSDEGLTEGTCGPTVYATYPLRRGELPRMLCHKRMRLQPST